MRKKAVTQGLIYVILIIVMLVVLFPFYMMVVISFSQSANITLPFPPKIIPYEFSLYNYKFILTEIKFLRYFVNTLQICLGGVLVGITSAALSGYAFSKLNFPLRRILFMIALCTMMIPGAIMMVPTYKVMRQIGLYNTYLVYFIPAVGNTFGMFFFKQFLDNMPNSLGESAKIDGANDFIIFLRIYLPLCGPIIATLVIMSFMGYYNDLFTALLYLESREKFNLQRVLAMYGGQYRDANGVNFAMVVMSTAPILAVFLIFQRHIVGSIAVTGIKQ